MPADTIVDDDFADNDSKLEDKLGLRFEVTDAAVLVEDVTEDDGVVMVVESVATDVELELRGKVLLEEAEVVFVVAAVADVIDPITIVKIELVFPALKLVEDTLPPDGKEVSEEGGYVSVTIEALEPLFGLIIVSDTIFALLDVASGLLDVTGL